MIKKHLNGKTMNYEKAYKEALAKCKAYIDDTQKRWSEEFCKATEEVFFEIFPKLKEPEGEKIRKAQLDYWRSVGGKEWHGVPVQKVIAWLEKQGEKKEINPTLQEKERMDDAFTKMMLKPQVDGFDAELNALLKKYEYLPNDEMVECLKFYTAELINNKQRMEQ